MKLRVCWRSESVAILVPAGSIWFSFFVASFLLSGPFDLKTSVTLAKGGAWRVVSKGTPIKVGSRVLTKGCSSPDDTRRLSAVLHLRWACSQTWRRSARSVRSGQVLTVFTAKMRTCVCGSFTINDSHKHTGL